MKQFRLTYEHLALALAILLGLSLRFLGLGAAPLNEAEANWALQALQMTNQISPLPELSPGPQPAYLSLTWAAFSLLRSSNFLARFWPALFGSLLPLVPFLLRDKLGRLPALVLAFGLAIDPGLVAASRQAGGPMLAIAAFCLAAGFWNTGLIVWAGIFAGVTLLSGPSFLSGLLGLAMAWGICRQLHLPIPSLAQRQDGLSGATPRPALIAAVLTVLILGAGFFWRPEIVSTWLGSLVTFFKGWSAPSGVPALQALFAFAIYQPLALLFTAAAIVRIALRKTGFSLVENLPAESQAETFERHFYLIWMLAALVFVLLYPSRQVVDLCWALIPLWVLAAHELAQHFPDTLGDPASLGQAAVVFLMLALSWLTLASSNYVVVEGEDSARSISLQILGAQAGVLVLIALVTALVALGSSWKTAKLGLAWGAAAALAVYVFSAAWSAAILHPNQPQEFWFPTPEIKQEKLLLSTIGDISEWTFDGRHEIDILSLVDTPSMRWALRNDRQTTFAASLPPMAVPSVIITRSEDEAPSLVESYRGQDFAWWVYPGWEGAVPPEFARWLTTRDAPVMQENIILWVRTDLFPGQSQPIQEDLSAEATE